MALLHVNFVKVDGHNVHVSLKSTRLITLVPISGGDHPFTRSARMFPDPSSNFTEKSLFPIGWFWHRILNGPGATFEIKVVLSMKSVTLSMERSPTLRVCASHLLFIENIPSPGISLLRYVHIINGS